MRFVVLERCWMEGREGPGSERERKDRAGSGSFGTRSGGFKAGRIANEGWYGVGDATYGAGTVLDGGGARDQDPSGKERIALVRDRSERVPVDSRPGGLQMRVVWCRGCDVRCWNGAGWREMRGRRIRVGGERARRLGIVRNAFPRIQRQSNRIDCPAGSR